MSDYLDGLDKGQMAAVMAAPTPTKVVAGAGSGKTRVLTTRIAHQIDSGVVKPENMFVAAFTRAAADEMGERVRLLVDAEQLNVGTFHGIMWRLLNAERDISNEQRFDICKEGERTRILQGLLGKPSKDYPKGLNSASDVGVVSGWISTWKNELIGCDSSEIKETVEESSPMTDIWAAASIYPLYEAQLKMLVKHDFDDMLMKAYELLSSDKDVLARARAQWNAFFVDEYQDTNRAQYEILKLIAPPSKSPNITIVGDPRQCLFRFRGAVPELMEDFGKTYKGTTSIDLTLNYRSTPQVIDHANQLARPFSMSSQTPHRAAGSEPIAIKVPGPAEQAVAIVEFVSAMRDKGRKGGDCAVLIRTNAQSIDIESAFVAARIPYWCNGGGFFDRMEIGDMMAYLRLAADHTDVNSLMRIINKPTRYLGKAFVEQVATNSRNYDDDLVDAIRFTSRYQGRALFAKQLEASMRLSDLLQSISPTEGSLINPVMAIKKVMADTNYLEWLRTTSGTSEGADDSRKENLDALIEVAARHGNLTGLLTFADEATALQVQSGDATEISTIHRSKGREWPYVIATNFYGGSIPHKLADGPFGFEDERRVAYVAYTRARDHLVVMIPETDAKGERIFPSPFVMQSGILIQEVGVTPWWEPIL